MERGPAVVSRAEKTSSRAGSGVMGRVLTPGDIRVEGAPQPIHRLDAGLEISLGEERQEGAGCHRGAAGPPQAVAPGQGSHGTPTVPGPRRSSC